MVFTLEEMTLLQAIHNKSPSDYSKAEKIIIKTLCEKNVENKVRQRQYFRKYLKTKKGREAHRRASKRYYAKKKKQLLESLN